MIDEPGCFDPPEFVGAVAGNICGVCSPACLASAYYMAAYPSCSMLAGVELRRRLRRLQVARSSSDESNLITGVKRILAAKTAWDR